MSVRSSRIHSMHKSPNYAARRPNDAFSAACNFKCATELRRGSPLVEIHRGAAFLRLPFSPRMCSAALKCIRHTFNRANDGDTPSARSRTFLNFANICPAASLGLLAPRRVAPLLKEPSSNHFLALGTYPILVNCCRNWN